MYNSGTDYERGRQAFVENRTEKEEYLSNLIRCIVSFCFLLTDFQNVCPGAHVGNLFGITKWHWAYRPRDYTINKKSNQKKFPQVQTTAGKYLIGEEERSAGLRRFRGGETQSGRGVAKGEKVFQGRHLRQRPNTLSLHTLGIHR